MYLVYFLTIIICLFLFSVIRNAGVKSFLVILPLAASLVCNYINPFLVNFLSELEFYVLLSFLLSQLLNYRVWVTKITLNRMNVDQNHKEKEPFIFPASQLLSLAFLRSLYTLNKYYFLQRLHFIGSTILILGEIIAGFSLVVLFLVSGFQVFLMPIIFSCLVFMFFGYLLEVLSSRIKPKYKEYDNNVT